MRRLVPLFLLGMSAACVPGGDDDDQGSPSSSSGSVTSSSRGTTTSGASSAAGTSSSRGSSSSSAPGSSSAALLCGEDGTTCMAEGYWSRCCNDTCVTWNDPAHCGECNHACNPGETCGGGECITATCNGTTTYCTRGDAGIGTCCGTECVDVEAAHDHCGGCFQSCSAQETCNYRECLVVDCTGLTTGTTCLASPTHLGNCCNGSCVDVWDSALDCGACGRACPTGGTCNQGMYCQAGEGWSQCSQDGGCAADLTCVDRQFCASPQCTPEREGFACATADGAAGLCCGQVCRATGSDPEHCGSCGHACAGNQWCLGAFCTDKPQCGAATANQACPLANHLPGKCCGAECVDTTTAKDACGTCGAACPVGRVCQGGNCTNPDGGYATCQSNAECPENTWCVGNTCRSPTCAPGATGQVCAFGIAVGMTGNAGTCCNGTCVNTAEDPENCVQCGQACASGVCTGGFMAACLPETHPGTSCPYDCSMGGLVCADGVCVRGACSGPFSETCLGPTGGVGICCPSGWMGAGCLDILSDPENCGGCGVACGTGSTCVQGRCSGVAAPCGAGQLGRYCNLDGGASFVCCGSGCADLASAEENCGYCGNACPDRQVCQGGRCAIADCTGSVDNTACHAPGFPGTCCAETCIDLSQDEQHCGECGHHCPNGTVCRDRTCGLEVCDAQHAGATCFGDGGVTGQCCAQGCVDPRSDHENCGGCGFPCAAQETCVDSVCR